VARRLVLALTVAAAGALLGRHVVGPLTAIIQAARTVPYGGTDLRLPATRVTGRIPAAPPREP
jgi:nitrogen fixation/metabolism regulation signal transduction histidine kinase